LKNKIVISFLLFLFISGICYGQDTIPQPPPVQEKIGEEIVSVKDTLSPPLDSLNQKQDSILQRKLATYSPPAISIDTTQKINYWHISERTGEIIPVRPDTFLTDYFNRTNVEGMGISMAYLGNLGLPLESRIFFEREDRSDFLFSDNLRAYLKQPDKYNFINTKIPYSNISYQSAGSNVNKEERFQALVTLNIGKKLNIGTSVDYLYARGFYNSQGSKHTDWVFFGNYLSDRHQVHLFINPAMAYTNGENGGLTDDKYISHPDWVSSRNMQTKDIPTQFGNTWNRMTGNRFYLNYRYNLGFERDTQKTDSLGETVKEFIPVSSAIYTFDYTDRKRHFDTQDSINVGHFYNYDNSYIKTIPADSMLNSMINSTSYRSIKNTFGLSLREGFSQWAKFDLTAYISHDFRQFRIMNLRYKSLLHYTFETINQNATFIGGELTKRSGKILRYNAQGSLGVVGYNVGDFNLSGTVETRIPFLNDTASVSATGFIKNIEPTFYEKKYYSQYISWDNNDFNKVRKVHIGGKIVIPHTKTEGSFGVENITNYIYFDSDGKSKQAKENIQVLAVNLQQNFKLGALHWDNQAVYQTSSNQTILPLPVFSAYSSLYLQFVISKVLTIQMGANAHYWTSYYSPTYEPATQQFKLQPEEEDKKVKTGEYPLIGGFLNCHLKQTRFFLEYYNLGALFISPPEYFSIPHYPVKPPVLRLGLSIDFIN
jgi:hypothetical protein